MKHHTRQALALVERNTPEAPPAPSTMPQWREGARGMPNSIARSAVFRALSNARKKDRLILDNEKVASVNGVDIWLSGEELSEEDCDAWLQLIHLTRGEPIDKPIVTCGLELLNMIDSGANSRDYARLKDSLRRLQKARIVLTFQIRNRTVEYMGNLLSEVTFTDEQNTGSTHWEIQLNRKMVNLFAADLYTQIDWNQRKELSPLAKSLHRIYSSHYKPFDMLVQSLYDQVGSNAHELRNFRPTLMIALQQLVDSGFLIGFKYDKRAELIHVDRWHPASVADTTEPNGQTRLL